MELITIIIATYNRGHYITESLLSIQKQTYMNWECLIIDDGGKDNTLENIKPLLKEDSRFKYYKRLDSYKKGISGSRNYGLDIAKGDCVIFYDDDDIIHPENLVYCLHAIDIKEADFCHYQKQSFEGKKPIIRNEPLKIVRELSKKDLDEIITHEYAMSSCTVLWNKKCFETIRFDEDLYYAEEWECYSRIISENFKGISLKNILYYNRKHPNSNTSQFWSNNSLRITSKKKATTLITQNLIQKELLSDKLFKYLIGIPIGFRDKFLLNTILMISKATPVQIVVCYLKYYLYPFWVHYKKIKK